MLVFFFLESQSLSFSPSNSMKIGNARSTSERNIRASPFLLDPRSIPPRPNEPEIVFISDPPPSLANTMIGPSTPKNLPNQVKLALEQSSKFPKKPEFVQV